MKQKRVLTIAGSDSGGGAGIQADLKTISALGGFGMSVITALTAQNTLGVQGIYEVPVGFVEQQFDSVASDIGIDTAKTGMLSSVEILNCVVKKIKEYKIEKLVVDPVMVAKDGAMLIREDAKKTLMEQLLPLAYVITPNIPEAEVLTGMDISTIDDMKGAARIIHGMGAKNALVKGGHLSGDAVDILYDGEDFYDFVSERIDTGDTHGTGCTFSAAIATGLAQGRNMLDAVRIAKEYTTTAIRFSLRLGRGHGPTNHFAYIFRECERFWCLEELKAAVQLLKYEKCANIIPEVQSNLVYALPYAVKVSEVAAVPGRIVKIGENVETLRTPEFGASSHVARIILTVMKYNSEYRSAMNIKLSEGMIGICKDLGYDVAHFSRSDEPEDVKLMEGSTLEWGTNSVLSQRNTMPDIIFDRGEVGKEEMVRILGKNPMQVVEMVLNISRRLKVL